MKRRNFFSRLLAGAAALVGMAAVKGTQADEDGLIPYPMTIPLDQRVKRSFNTAQSIELAERTRLFPEGDFSATTMCFGEVAHEWYGRVTIFGKEYWKAVSAKPFGTFSGHDIVYAVVDENGKIQGYRLGVYKEPVVQMASINVDGMQCTEDGDILIPDAVYDAARRVV